MHSKPYATMQSNGQQAAEIAFALSVALGATNFSQSQTPGIACCEAQGWSYARDILSEMQSASAEQTLSLIPTHAYKGNPAAPDSPLNTTLPVWISENSPIMDRLGFTQVWHATGAENEGLVWANYLHDAFVKGNVSAYVYWIGAGQHPADVPLIWAPNRNPAHDSRSGLLWGLEEYTEEMIKNETLPFYEIGSTYWALAHWGRFVRPGARRVEANVTDGPEDILVSAYQNQGNGTIVVQVVNNGNGDVATSVSVLGLDISPPFSGTRRACAAQIFVTDNERRFEYVDVLSLTLIGEFETVLAKRSLTTFVVRC